MRFLAYALEVFLGMKKHCHTFFSAQFRFIPQISASFSGSAGIMNNMNLFESHYTNALNQELQNRSTAPLSKHTFLVISECR